MSEAKRDLFYCAKHNGVVGKIFIDASNGRKYVVDDMRPIPKSSRTLLIIRYEHETGEFSPNQEKTFMRPHRNDSWITDDMTTARVSG